MPVIIILAPQFWHLGRLSMILSGLGINWGWGMGSSCFRRERYRALSHRRLAQGRAGDGACSVSIPRKSGQNGSLSKGATAKFERDDWAQGVERGPVLKEQIGNPAQTECPLLGVKQTFRNAIIMSALPPKADTCGAPGGFPLCAVTGHLHRHIREVPAP